MRPVSLLRAIVIALVASLVMGIPALAQAAAPPEGITVPGLGRASAPADSTTFQITLSSGMFEGPGGWQPVGTPDASDHGPVQPLVDALVNAGVPEGDMSVVVAPYIGNGMYGPYGPIAAFVEFTIDDPSMDRLREIIDAANMGAAESMMMLGDVTTVHTVTDCSALQEEALANAFDDAHARAARQASIAGVSVGDVTALRDTFFGYTPITDPSGGFADDGNCSYNSSSVTRYGPSGPMPYDITAEPEVVVYASMDVTFAIEPGSPATPES